MDHNETLGRGHDAYDEGFHVDVAQRSKRTVHVEFPHPPLPPKRGTLIRECIKYVRREADYFIDVYEERRPPGRPPRWPPDGGDSAGTYIHPNLLEENMSREASVEEEVLSLEELTELLAEAEGTTPQDLKHQGEEFEIGPPEKAQIVGYGGQDPLTEHDDE